MRPELRNLARRFFADVEGDPDHAEQRPDKDERDQPGGNMANAKRVIETREAGHRLRSVQENLCDPRDHDEDEDEDIIPLQAASDRFQLADFEPWQNEIFTNQFLPLALQHLPVLHHHRYKKMRLEHADARAKGIVEPVAPRFDPEHPPDDREIEKEDDVRDLAIRKR